ncbi:MAG TPA: hypothetical protein VK674_02450 [Candidatus Limnocylindria bacterium]|nr:hypothetical protein [Candidatus Limnocylindria bacterium]
MSHPGRVEHEPLPAIPLAAGAVQRRLKNLFLDTTQVYSLLVEASDSSMAFADATDPHQSKIIERPRGITRQDGASISISNEVEPHAGTQAAAVLAPWLLQEVRMDMTLAITVEAEGAPPQTVSALKAGCDITGIPTQVAAESGPLVDAIGDRGGAPSIGDFFDAEQEHRKHLLMMRYSPELLGTPMASYVRLTTEVESSRMSPYPQQI